MNLFSNWLLSIVGVVILGVLIDVVLPNSSMSKYIKAIFAFIIILVIVMPLTKINGGEVSIENILEKNKIELDENYIFNLNQKILNQIKNNIINDSSKQGLHNIEISFVSEIESYSLKINEVNVFLYDLVIDENIKHIDKYQILIDIVMTYIKIDKEHINFYE